MHFASLFEPQAPRSFISKPKNLLFLIMIWLVLDLVGGAVVGVDSLCGWVYLSGGSSPGVPWFFRDQGEYVKQILARVDTEVLASSWIWIRSSSQIGELAKW